MSDYKADVSAVHEQASIFVRGSQERSNGRSSLPPVALSAYLKYASMHVYLTADEAALLGKSLLEAATFVVQGENVHTLADALAAPGGGAA
jgi:hypothetical protein